MTITQARAIVAGHRIAFRSGKVEKHGTVESATMDSFLILYDNGTWARIKRSAGIELSHLILVQLFEQHERDYRDGQGGPH